MSNSIKRFTPGILPRLLLCLLAAAPWAQAEEKLLDRVIAIVGNDIIVQSELTRRSDSIRQQLLERNTQLPDAATFNRQVLDKLIIDRIQLHLAAANGIEVSNDELNGTLDRIARSNKLSLTQFKQQLEAEGQNYLEAREQIRSEILVTRTQERLVNQRIHISEQEINNLLTSEQGRINAEPRLHIGHIMIPLATSASPEQINQTQQQAVKIHQQLLEGADFAATALAVSKGAEALKGGDIGWRKPSELPAAVAEAVQTLKTGELTEPFRIGGGFHILKVIERRGGEKQLVDQTQVRHILITPNAIRSPREAELLIYEIYRRLNDGEDFAILAKQHSDDPGSGSNGGDLGWTMDGQMVPEFEQVLHASATGEISAPFKTQFGWHLLQVTERRQQDFGEEILRKQATETIRKRKFAESLATWIREIRAETYVEIKQ
ncbi:MAG: peptidyl-prolyl cis-trans isomerase SurA [Motiliproteus sp.]|jgi:peptidyl-prolyl cis-trans isomerase SurA